MIRLLFSRFICWMKMRDARIAKRERGGDRRVKCLFVVPDEIKCSPPQTGPGRADGVPGPSGAQHSVWLQAGPVLSEVLHGQVPTLPRHLPQEHLLHISHLRPPWRGPSGEAGISVIYCFGLAGCCGNKRIALFFIILKSVTVVIYLLFSFSSQQQ